MKRILSQQPARGFTLIEVMITVVIVSILAAVALPAYNRNVLKTQRAVAKGVLMENAQLLERIYTTNNSYGVAAAPGAAAPASAVSPKGSTGLAVRYKLTVVSDANTFTLTATPSTEQAKDECGTLTLTNTGRQTPATGGCW